MDDLSDKVSQMNTHIAVYNEQLKIHIAATNLNKEEIEEIKEDLEPIKDHIKFLSKLGKLLAGVATLGATLAALFEYFKN